MLNKQSNIFAAAALLGTGLIQNKVYGAANIQRVVTHARKYKSYGGSSCYQPHQGEREIARRLRQAARNEANQMGRGGIRGLLVSRRGRILG